MAFQILASEYNFCPKCSISLSFRTEEGHTRRYCDRCKIIYRPRTDIAVAGILTYDLNVLMVKRKREPFLGTWMFPAGFLEHGEHPEETLIREIREETGLKVLSPTFLKIEKAILDYRSPNHLVLFYEATWEGTIKNNDTDENSDIRWHPIRDDIEIGFPHHKKVFQELRVRRV